MTEINALCKVSNKNLCSISNSINNCKYTGNDPGDSLCFGKPSEGCNGKANIYRRVECTTTPACPGYTEPNLFCKLNTCFLFIRFSELHLTLAPSFTNLCDEAKTSGDEFHHDAARLAPQHGLAEYDADSYPRHDADRLAPYEE